MNIDCEIDDQDFQDLIKFKMIERDYITGKIIVRIPIFEGETDENVQFQSKVMEVRNIVADRVNEYRTFFKGIRAKSIGEKQSVIDALTRWLLTYPSYTFDDILEATRYYIEITEPKYISNADNFIFREVRPGDIESMLFTVIEQIELDNDNKVAKRMI